MKNLTWQPQAMMHFPLIEHLHVAPDSHAVLYTIRTAHLTDDASEFRDQVFVASTQGATPPRRLTFGLGASQPKWSPDGTLIAFLRTQAQNGSSPGYKSLWIMPAAGGEARALLPPEDGPVALENVLQFEWRADSRAIAFTAVPTDPERRRRTRQKDDVQQWRVDYNFAHLFVVEFEPTHPEPGARAIWQQFTTGRQHVESFAWHPAGTELAFIAQDTPHAQSWPSSRLLSVPVPVQVPMSSPAPDNSADSNPSPAPTQIAPLASWKSTVRYSPDGAWIACQQGIADNRWAYAGRVHIFPTGASPTGASPTEASSTGTSATHANRAASRALADVSDAQPGLIGWTPDSLHVLVADDQGLGTAILALPIDGGPAQTIVTGDEPATVFHVNEQGVLALVRQNHHKLNGVEIVETDPAHTNGAPLAPRRIATPDAPGYPQGPLPQIQELRWQTDDDFEIEGILYLPPEYDVASGEKLPFLLHIHGGPMGVFQRLYAGTPYYYPPAALCELGFAVLRCNPRGSSGYGKDFRFANIQDWGGGDYRDLMQGVDRVIEMGIADPARLGVCGWSYGGFMSSWIITQTHRFQAASIGAPVTNSMTFPATADIPGFVPDYYGGEPWEVFDFYRDYSPIFHAHKVRTPAIIQHGGADERVPLEQGQQYYYVLAGNNVPVELFIYPRQGHAISEPRLLTDAIQRNLEWFSGQLNTGEAQDAGISV